MKFVIPMPEQIPASHIVAIFLSSHGTSGKCIVGVPTCSGMGATNLKFLVSDDRLQGVR